MGIGCELGGMRRDSEVGGRAEASDGGSAHAGTTRRWVFLPPFSLLVLAHALVSSSSLYTPGMSVFTFSAIARTMPERWDEMPISASHDQKSSCAQEVRTRQWTEPSSARRRGG